NTTNNASALTTTTTTTTATSAQNPAATVANSINSNNARLNQFNRLATERKTVHVMGLGRDNQMKRGDKPMAVAAGYAGNSNTLSHQSYVPGQSTLDYTMNTRSNTSHGSFLQKLSSKFTRRYTNESGSFKSRFGSTNSSVTVPVCNSHSLDVEHTRSRNIRNLKNAYNQNRVYLNSNIHNRAIQSASINPEQISRT
ncbi:hypothetical protein BpHYR1_024579, partial [Brachionus plicatilis]